MSALVCAGLAVALGWRLCLVYPGGPLRPSTPDRSALTPAMARSLAALADSVDGLENRQLSDLAFQRAVPRATISRWLSLQRRLPPFSVDDKNVAFVLAYHRIDYRRNVARLLGILHNNDAPPSRVKRAGPKAVARWLSQRESGGPVIEVLPEDFGALYEHLRRPDLLADPLGMGLDGASAEAQADTLEHLWASSARAIIGAAYGSRDRAEGLVSMVVYMSGPDATLKKAIMARLGHANAGGAARQSAVRAVVAAFKEEWGSDWDESPPG